MYHHLQVALFRWFFILRIPVAPIHPPSDPSAHRFARKFKAAAASAPFGAAAAFAAKTLRRAMGSGPQGSGGGSRRLWLCLFGVLLVFFGGGGGCCLSFFFLGGRPWLVESSRREAKRKKAVRLLFKRNQKESPKTTHTHSHRRKGLCQVFARPQATARTPQLFWPGQDLKAIAT